MKKKILALGIAAAMVFSLAACGGGGNETASKDNSKLVIIDSEWYGIDTYQLDSSGGMQGMASTPLFTWDSETNEMVDGVCTKCGAHRSFHNYTEQDVYHKILK